jgi:hypothetical protein
VRVRPLRSCLEIKRKLDGREQTFACGLVALTASHGILRYVVDRDIRLSGVGIFPGCVSYAVYWPDRPYNAYWFVEPSGRSLAFYFNIADSTALAADVFRWRDLTLDVLVLPDGSAEVLDADELPADLEPALRDYVFAARDAILAAPRALSQEVRAVVERATRGA